MSSISRVILLEPEPSVGGLVRYGLERAGITVTGVLAEPEAVAQVLAADDAPLLISRDSDSACVVAALSRHSSPDGRVVPGRTVLFLGDEAQSVTRFPHTQDSVVQPLFVRDVVTAVRVLGGRKPGSTSVLSGELVEHFGMFYLLRALVALRRRGVFSIVRGLRRGELRFYDGEVTSAQVGMLHGLAALHQLLLWTQGHYEFRPEDVVRRQQIPLSPTELVADAERFLSETEQVFDRLSPASNYRRSNDRVEGLPEPVELVWRLFDENRTLADIIEDSPFRMYETLAIANRLAHLNLIDDQNRRPGDLATTDPSPHAMPTTASGASASAADWSKYLPDVAKDPVSSPSIVPAAVAAGEISTVAVPVREGLEEKSLAAAAQLQQQFADNSVPDHARTVPFVRVVIGDEEAATQRLSKWSRPADDAADPPKEVPVTQMVESKDDDGTNHPMPNGGSQRRPDMRRRRKKSRQGNRHADKGLAGPTNGSRNLEAASQSPTPSASRDTPSTVSPAMVQVDQLIRVADQVFSADEEAFFAAGADLAKKAAPKSESFDDLDEAYEMPRTFWERFLRRPNSPLKNKK